MISENDGLVGVLVNKQELTLPKDVANILNTAPFRQVPLEKDIEQIRQFLEQIMGGLKEYEKKFASMPKGAAKMYSDCPYNGEDGVFYELDVKNSWEMTVGGRGIQLDTEKQPFFRFRYHFAGDEDKEYSRERIKKRAERDKWFQFFSDSGHPNATGGVEDVTDNVEVTILPKTKTVMFVLQNKGYKKQAAMSFNEDNDVYFDDKKEERYKSPYWKEDKEPYKRLAESLFSSMSKNSSSIEPVIKALCGIYVAVLRMQSDIDKNISKGQDTIAEMLKKPVYTTK